MEMGLREESSEHHWLGLVTPQGVGVKHGVQIQPFIVVAPNKYNACFIKSRQCGANYLAVHWRFPRAMLEQRLHQPKVDRPSLSTHCLLVICCSSLQCRCRLWVQEVSWGYSNKVPGVAEMKVVDMAPVLVLWGRAMLFIKRDCYHARKAMRYDRTHYKSFVRRRGGQKRT